MFTIVNMLHLSSDDLCRAMSSSMQHGRRQLDADNWRPSPAVPQCDSDCSHPITYESLSVTPVVVTRISPVIMGSPFNKLCTPHNITGHDHGMPCERTTPLG